MRTRTKTRRAEHPPALCTDPSVGDCRSSDKTDPLQHNGDTLINRNQFVGGLPGNTGGSQVPF